MNAVYLLNKLKFADVSGALSVAAFVSSTSPKNFPMNIFAREVLLQTEDCAIIFFSLKEIWDDWYIDFFFLLTLGK